jgi:hypothetical protein
MISSAETRPIATSISIVNIMTPAPHVRPAGSQILAATTLPKVECIQHEETVPIRRMKHLWRPAPPCTQSLPSVSCVRTLVPEEYTSSTSTLEMFNSDKAPSTNMLCSLTISPAMTAIVIDEATVVDKKLAAVV